MEGQLSKADAMDIRVYDVMCVVLRRLGAPLFVALPCDHFIINMCMAHAENTECYDAAISICVLVTVEDDG